MTARAPVQHALAMLCATSTLAAQTLPPVENIGGVSLPGVPVSVATAAVEAGNAARSAAEGSGPTESVTEPATPTTLSVAPGTTELIRIARGYLNHLKTPFFVQVTPKGDSLTSSRFVPLKRGVASVVSKPRFK